MHILPSKAYDPNFWTTLKSNPNKKRVYDILVETYKNDFQKNIPVIDFSLWNEFKKNGTRVNYENAYFYRRRLLSVSALLALIHPENEEYLQTVNNLIWAICDEYSWSLPAHINKEGFDNQTFIDISASETAGAIAEILVLLQDKLHPEVYFRATKEIKRRIIDSYLKQEFWWEKSRHNWTTVCLCGVTSCILTFESELFVQIKDRLLTAIKGYEDRITDDGVCAEGISYWTYGFENYVWLADMLFRHTDGEINLFDNPKMEIYATFPQKCFLKGNATISFSDGERNAKIGSIINSYLHQKYPNSVKLLPLSATKIITNHTYWQPLSRAFIFDEKNSQTELELEDCFFSYVGQAIVHKKNYSLFVKAGCNKEPHNHNDIGSFILATKNGQVFVDFGAGEYNGQYYSNRRYEILCTSSRGHSVPIINGEYQKFGIDYCGTINNERDKITVNFNKAYGIQGFDKLTRTFIHDEQGFTLTDEFNPDFESLTERFVTLSKPEVYENFVLVDGVKVYFNPEHAILSINSEIQKSHDTSNCTVYIIDFEIEKKSTSVQFKFII